MLLSRFTAALFALLAALPSPIAATAAPDAMLDSLAFAAVNHDLSGRSADRDRTEDLLVRALQERLSADSSDAAAHKRLRELRRLQDNRTKSREAAWNEIRRLSPEKAMPRLEEFLQRFPEHAEARELRTRIRRPPPSTPSTASIPAPADSHGQVVPPSSPDSAASIWITPIASQMPQAANSKAETSRCTDLSRIEWTHPKPPQFQTASSQLRILANIWAPCGIARISLIRGIGDIQALPIPEKSGVYSIEADVSIQRGAQTLLIQFCDSLNNCRRSEPIEIRRVFIMPLPVLATIVGLFLSCLVLAIFILARRRPGTPAPPRSGLVLGPSGQAAQSAGAPAPSGRTPSDLASAIRDALARTTRTLGPKAARQTLRIPASLPAITAPPEELAAALDAVFTFAYRRAGADGQVMIATGRGPRNLEMVIEDDGESGDEQAIRGLLDSSVTVVKERLGLDRELIAAAEFFRLIGGELNAEVRIEGGWRLRARLPIAPKPALAPVAS